MIGIDDERPLRLDRLVGDQPGQAADVILVRVADDEQRDRIRRRVSAEQLADLFRQARVLRAARLPVAGMRSVDEDRHVAELEQDRVAVFLGSAVEQVDLDGLRGIRRGVVRHARHRFPAAIVRIVHRLPTRGTYHRSSEPRGWGAQQNAARSTAVCGMRPW
jgi:hypothetical protein